jgi:poly(A) polymerase
MTEREQSARWICSVLHQNGFRALLAGGCVRDLLLGVPPKDYDIATNASVAEIADLFPRTADVGAVFGVMLVLMPGGPIEVATFRRDGPYDDGRHPAYVQRADEREDALRRDFTINSLFFDPREDKVIDYTGGQEDLRRGVLRAVGDPRLRFSEDHLRLMRAVRFAARLGFDMTPETFSAVREMAALITRTSAERVRDELVKMLSEGGARRALELMDQTGLLPHVLPEVAALKGVSQPEAFHPEGDVFAHTLLMLEHLHDPSPALAMAALLHDVGKPLTQTFEDRIRFNHHDLVGARITEDICRRLRFSNEETQRAVWLVEQHMRVGNMPEMRESKRRRLVREPGFPELLDLARLDCLASHRDLSLVEWIEDYLKHLTPEKIHPQPLLRGRDLIQMGYAPGPRFTEILKAVEDAQLDGTVADPEAAREYVRMHWPR